MVSGLGLKHRAMKFAACAAEPCPVGVQVLSLSSQGFLKFWVPVFGGEISSSEFLGSGGWGLGRRVGGANRAMLPAACAAEGGPILAPPPLRGFQPSSFSFGHFGCSTGVPGSYENAPPS